MSMKPSHLAIADVPRKGLIRELKLLILLVSGGNLAGFFLVPNR